MRIKQNASVQMHVFIFNRSECKYKLNAFNCKVSMMFKSDSNKLWKIEFGEREKIKCDRERKHFEPF